MARRLIGLDIGTNAVTVAEVRAGDPPRLVMFGQCAGPRGHGEGEVADDADFPAPSQRRSRIEEGRRAP
jgi:hypothetical protein